MEQIEKPIKIGNVSIKNRCFLAPMAGFTDIGFRSLAKRFGAGLTYSEMVSAKGIYYNNVQTLELLKKTEEESPFALQLFGHEKDVFKKIPEKDIFKDLDIIDINMGCPALKIIKNGDGSALMRDLKVASDVIKTAVESFNKPITVKFRSGFDEEHINCVEFAVMCECSGAAAVTVHARTAKQMYFGTADRKLIAEVKRAVKIPVIANGDIDSFKSAKDMFETTGCDAVMIGRGALGRPWIFAELLNSVFEIDRLSIIKYHYDMLKNSWGEKFALLNMRKHISFYLKGIQHTKNLKTLIQTENNFDNVLKMLQEVL